MQDMLFHEEPEEEGMKKLMVESQVGGMNTMWLTAYEWLDGGGWVCHNAAMLVNTLNSGKIGLDMHEHMRPAAVSM